MPQLDAIARAGYGYSDEDSSSVDGYTGLDMDTGWIETQWTRANIWHDCCQGQIALHKPCQLGSAGPIDFGYRALGKSNEKSIDTWDAFEAISPCRNHPVAN